MNAQIEEIRHIIRDQWLAEDDSRPWVIGYSAGKDSTCLLHMVVSVLLELSSDKRTIRPLVITMGDTLVENPVMQNHADKMWEILQQYIPKVLPDVKFIRTTPEPDKTFWTLLLGKGYRAPTRDFRWCTDRLKILPTQSIARQYPRAIWLVGTRRNESALRNANFKKREGQGRITHRSANMDKFEPLEHLTTDDLWAFLLQNPPPWGGSHRDLISLYRSAVGECPVVLSPDDAPSCGSQSARFGCWTCTVVKKDKSLQALADGEEGIRLEPLLEFRERLREVSEVDSGFRDMRRRSGQPGAGPLKLSIRKQLLQELLDIQEEINHPLISQQEITEIQRIWQQDGERIALSPEEKAFISPLVCKALASRQGSEYQYMCIVTFGDLVRICEPPKEAPSVEERFQRDTSWKRADMLARYIQDNRDTYVLPPITLCSDKLTWSESEQTITLQTDALTWLVDGQHRRAGIELALERDRTLEHETIGVVFHTYTDKHRLRQLFADLNSGKPIPRSVRLYMDRRVNSSLADLCALEPFRGIVDPVNTSVSTRSSYLWTLSALEQADNVKTETLDLWKRVLEMLPGMAAFRAGKLSANQLRASYIWAHGVGLRALGEVLLEYSPEALAKVDWHRKAAHWEGSAVQKGKMQADGHRATAEEVRRQISKIYAEFELVDF